MTEEFRRLIEGDAARQMADGRRRERHKRLIGEPEEAEPRIDVLDRPGKTAVRHTSRCRDRGEAHDRSFRSLHLLSSAPAELPSGAAVTKSCPKEPPSAMAGVITAAGLC